MQRDEGSQLRQAGANPADPFGRQRNQEPPPGRPVERPYQYELEAEALRAEIHSLRAELSALRRRNGSLVLTLITLQSRPIARASKGK